MDRIMTICGAIFVVFLTTAAPAYSRGGGHGGGGGFHGGGAHFGGTGRFRASSAGIRAAGTLHRSAMGLGRLNHVDANRLGAGRFHHNRTHRWAYARGLGLGGALVSGAYLGWPYYGDGYDDWLHDDYDVATASNFCAQRYRSYDPNTGTYIGYDGRRHPCP